MTHFDLNFVYDVKKYSKFISLNVVSIYPELLVEKTCSASLNCFGSSVENIYTEPHSLDYCSTFEIG